MAQQQRHLISEARFLLKHKENVVERKKDKIEKLRQAGTPTRYERSLLLKQERKLYELQRDMYFIEQLILKDDYIESQRKKQREGKRVIEFREAQKRKKKSELKAAMGGVRDV